ncbi:MAG: membrane protein [Planctomycetaceae bacterium]|nr:MAG: membrane protein [Planctomycetaceae bacterium]
MPTHRSHLPPLLWVVLLALVVRLPVAAWRWDSLSDDRDHYRLLADGLSDGRGLVHPDHGTPTAYRPPLYRCCSPASSWSGAGQVGIVALHLLLGLVTVAGTWQTAIHLGLGHRAWWPAAAVGIDPLLVVGATLPMTETLFTALAVWMLAVATSTPSTRRGLTLGLLFGLAALCRPRCGLCGGNRPAHADGPVPETNTATLVSPSHGPGRPCCRSRRDHRPLADPQPVGSATPVLTTTHGGFTLLLGNNPVFYEQVVRRRLGTTWNDTTSDPGRTPADWRDSLEQRLGVPPQGVAAERKRDIKMYRLAMTNVADDPTGFLRACLLRVLRFWTPWPSESAPESSWPVALKWGRRGMVRGNVAGQCCGDCGPGRGGWALNGGLRCCNLLAISLVHVVFWSTMRMRAPVMPIVFLLACVGLVRKPADAGFGRRYSRGLLTLRKTWTYNPAPVSPATGVHTGKIPQPASCSRFE